MAARTKAQGSTAGEDAPDLRAEAGARFLQHYLGGTFLPRYVPGEPRAMAAHAAAADAAPRFLRVLASLYGVREWNAEAFRRAYVDGALAAWRPGTTVDEHDGKLRVSSPVCPLLVAAEPDPRACLACRFFNERVARLTQPDQVGRVGFESLITRGERACVMVVENKTSQQVR